MLPLPSTGIHLPSFGSPMLIAANAALAIVSLGWVGFGLLRGSDAGVEDEPGAAGGVSGGAAGTEVAVARPVVGPIVAVLIPPVTTYSIEAGSRAGLELTYRWSLEADPGEDCGTITPSDHDDPTAGLTSVAWSHANEAPDGCRHDAPDHPFTVRVEVSDGVNPPEIRTYRGSDTGTGTDGD